MKGNNVTLNFFECCSAEELFPIITTLTLRRNLLHWYSIELMKVYIFFLAWPIFGSTMCSIVSEYFEKTFLSISETNRKRKG